MSVFLLTVHASLRWVDTCVGEIFSRNMTIGTSPCSTSNQWVASSLKSTTCCGGTDSWAGKVYGGSCGDFLWCSLQCSLVGYVRATNFKNVEMTFQHESLSFKFFICLNAKSSTYEVLFLVKSKLFKLTNLKGTIKWFTVIWVILLPLLMYTCSRMENQSKAGQVKSGLELCPESLDWFSILEHLYVRRGDKITQITANHLITPLGLTSLESSDLTRNNTLYVDDFAFKQVKNLLIWGGSVRRSSFTSCTFGQSAVWFPIMRS